MHKKEALEDTVMCSRCGKTKEQLEAENKKLRKISFAARDYLKKPSIATRRRLGIALEGLKKKLKKQEVDNRPAKNSGKRIPKEDRSLEGWCDIILGKREKQ